MSYIVPKEIPKCCIECPCGYETEGAFSDVCSVLAREYEKDADSVRPNWCPLVEVKTPHGRLIDADELVRIWKGAKFYGHIDPIVDARPTAIEAEWGGE